jgi:predicted membrane protein
LQIGCISVVAMIILFSLILQDKPSLVNPQSNVIFPPNSLANTVQNISGVISFLLIWGGTILLLHHNIHRIGKVKFWALVSTPLIFFSSFYLSFFQSIAGPVPTGEDPITSIVIPILVIIFSGITAATLIGVAFRSVAMALSHTPIIRDYLIITSYGFILFFTATLTSIAGTGYPPFGLVNVLLLGPFSFLVLNGLYRSAICVAEDTKLRRSIRTLAQRESKLLDMAATAEIQRDIQNRVTAAVRTNAELLEEQSGVESSLTDSEIREQLETVTQELKKYW